MIEFLDDVSAKEHQDRETIFMSEAGVLYSEDLDSPFLPFAETQFKANLSIQSVYSFKKDKLFACFKKNHVSNELEKRGFKIHSPKFLLSGEGVFDQSLAIKAIQTLTWEINIQYCSRCGGFLKNQRGIPQKKCVVCEQFFFPKVCPAIIVLVHRGRDVLLARSPHFKKGVYSTIAGFIEVGESAEEAVHREVQEETGIQIQSLQYMGTQSWPFPESFMIGFHAEYKSGDLVIDEKELEDAAWFDINSLPELPSKSSISYQLISDFMGSFLVGKQAIAG